MVAANTKKLIESKQVTYQQPSPVAQGSYMTVAMAGSIIGTWALDSFLPGVRLTPEVITAASVLAGWAAGKWGT